MRTDSMQWQSADVAAGRTPPLRKAPILCSVTIDETTGEAIITASGEVDPSTAHRLRKVCATTRHSALNVVIDLAAVTYLGAAGLAVLCEDEAAARASGGRSRLRNPSHPVRIAIEACDLGSRLTID